METTFIGNKIAEARKKISISQAQLAQQLFISAQAVGKWERGESFPDIITFNRLAKILGVDLNYFSEDFASRAGEPELSGAPVTDMAELKTAKKQNKLNWNMSGSNWVGADFSGLKSLHDKFSSSNMQRCLFIDSDLSGLMLKNNNIDSCDFTGSRINNSTIQGSLLNKNTFKGCSLEGTEFSSSFLHGCDFTGADFTGVFIKSGGIAGVYSKAAGPEKNTIARAVWNRTSFINTQIADLTFTGKFEDCCFENCAFTRVTFQDATLINTFFKNNKNLKRIRFVGCKADRMTYEFLKQGKADLTGITLMAPFIE